MRAKRALPVLVAVLTAAVDVPFTICPGSNDALGIQAFRISPGRIKSDGGLRLYYNYETTFHLELLPAVDVVNGTTATVTVDAFGTNVVDETVAVCEKIACPVPAGTASGFCGASDAMSEHAAELALSDSLDLRIVVNGRDGEELTCLDVVIEGTTHDPTATDFDDALCTPTPSPSAAPFPQPSADPSSRPSPLPSASPSASPRPSPSPSTVTDNIRTVKSHASATKHNLVALGSLCTLGVLILASFVAAFKIRKKIEQRRVTQRGGDGFAPLGVPSQPATRRPSPAFTIEEPGRETEMCEIGMRVESASIDVEL